jgi:PAS domain S-box-containing protein
VKSQYILLVNAINKEVRLNKAENSLREEKKNYFRQITDTIQEGIVILENDNIIYINSQIKKIYGFSKSDIDLLTRNSSNLDDLKEHLKQFKDESQVDNRLSRRELEIERTNGEKRTILMKYSHFLDQEINMKYIVVSDITKEKRTDEKKEAAYNELEQVFQVVPDGLRIISSDYNILKVSDELLKIMQYKRKDVIGAKCYDTFPGSKCNTPECSVKKITKGEKKIVHFETKELKNGQQMDVLVTSFRLEDPHDNSIRILEHFKVLTQGIETKDHSSRPTVEK